MPSLRSMPRSTRSFAMASASLDFGLAAIYLGFFSLGLVVGVLVGYSVAK